MSVDKQRLGTLLDEMIRMLCARQHRSMSEIMGSLSEHLGVKPDAVYKWRQGVFAPREDAVAYLVQVGVAEAGMNRAWAEEVLTLTNHPDRPDYLARLFPLTVAAQPASEAVQHNLPHLQHHTLYGRDREKVEILERLAPTSRYGIVPIVGSAGIGKTSLALEIAWQLLNPCDQMSEQVSMQALTGTFDAILYASANKRVLDMRDIWERPAVSLRGLNDLCTMIPEMLAPALLRPDASALEDRVRAIIRALRQAGRVLLILDDLDALADGEIRSVLNLLREIPATTKVIITAHVHEDLPWPIQLPGLDAKVMQHVLEDECHAHLKPLSESESKRLIEASHGIPLAAKWFVWRMILQNLTAQEATRPDASYNQPLYTFLRDPHGRLAAAAAATDVSARRSSASASSTAFLSRAPHLRPAHVFVRREDHPHRDNGLDVGFDRDRVPTSGHISHEYNKHGH